MIVEALSYLLSPAPKWVKKLGYLSESIGIEARYDRCKEAWQEHLDQSKSAILEAAESCELKRTALIVGSGPGYDLPLEELLSIFSRVILVDAVHPRSIKKLAKKLGKSLGKGRIMFVTGDITELSDTLLDNPTQIPQIPNPSLYHGFLDIDLIVSLNIASQLPITPTKWLQKHGVDDEAKLQGFGRGLITAHLNWLNMFEGKSLLICDRQWTKKEMLQGRRVVERDDPLQGVNMPRPDKLWKWHICPIDEMPKLERDAALSRENIVGVHSL